MADRLQMVSRVRHIHERQQNLWLYRRLRSTGISFGAGKIPDHVQQGQSCNSPNPVKDGLTRDCPFTRCYFLSQHEQALSMDALCGRVGASNDQAIQGGYHDAEG